MRYQTFFYMGSWALGEPLCDSQFKNKTTGILFIFAAHEQFQRMLL